jgi:antirestriction protein
MSQLQENDPTINAEPGEAESAIQRPEIWVGAAEDYQGERRYGDWIDAAAEPTELMTNIRTILERTPDPGRQRWSIYDLRGFGGWEPDDRQGLPTVSMVARGIAVHGLAYSALVKLVSADTLAARPDRFRLSFVGDWPSLQAFAASFVEESGWNERLERLPDSMRPYVRLDVNRLIRDAKRELSIVDHETGIWVFDPRCW